MMFNKSQVTVFVIISLIILTMVGVAYYMIGSAQTKKGEEQVRKQQVSAVKLDPLKEYVSSCLSITSAEGFELLGKQGGYIYKSQGGFIDDPAPEDYSEYQMTKVHYSIYAPLSDVGVLFFAKPPAYPFLTFPRVYNQTGDIVYDNYMRGYYGRNKILPLYKPRENSLQEQLEKFTINGTLECIDWSDFERQGINITEKAEPNVSVTFAESDVSFYLNWPLEVKDIGTGAVTDMEEFIVMYPVRLERIHNFAAFLLDLDVSNISFDIRASDGEISAYIFPDIEGKDDLIKVVDSRSNILGQEYEFRFMRENRPPALYYLNASEFVAEEVCNGTSVGLGANNTIIVDDECSDNRFVINLTYLDPDEEEANFTFNPSLSRAQRISRDDAVSGSFEINVSVSDGEYTDWQVISIPAKLG